MFGLFVDEDSLEADYTADNLDDIEDDEVIDWNK
jgi:hypothetical protein|tara:strand:- start:615 stop:716 length:102 start_codon:yes stop_codon:yes gene_type:complete